MSSSDDSWPPKANHMENIEDVYDIEAAKALHCAERSRPSSRGIATVCNAKATTWRVIEPQPDA